MRELNEIDIVELGKAKMTSRSTVATADAFYVSYTNASLSVCQGFRVQSRHQINKSFNSIAPSCAPTTKDENAKYSPTKTIQK